MSSIWSRLINLGGNVTGILANTHGGTSQNSTATFPTSGVVVTEAGTETLTNKSMSGSANTFTNISLTSSVTGLLPANNGGVDAWTSFTPTFAGLGMVGTTQFWYQAYGKTVHIRGTVVTGTTAASTSAILLAIFTIDSTKLSTFSTMAGIFNRMNATNVFSAGNDGAVFYDGSTTDRLFFAIGKTTSGFTPINGATAFGSTETVSIDFVIPII